MSTQYAGLTLPELLMLREGAWKVVEEAWRQEIGPLWPAANEIALAVESELESRGVDVEGLAAVEERVQFVYDAWRPPTAEALAKVLNQPSVASSED